MTLPFISRHTPTAAQAATVRERFGELDLSPTGLVFEPGEVNEQIMNLLLNDEQFRPDTDGYYTRIAGVFPGWALLELLRDGWTVVEFVNEPDARQRGAFVCRGAFVHTYAPRDFGQPDELRSEFLACPIPPEQQNPSPLLAGHA